MRGNSHFELVLGWNRSALASVTQKLLNEICDISTGDRYGFDGRSNDIAFGLQHSVSGIALRLSRALRTTGIVSRYLCQLIPRLFVMASTHGSLRLLNQ